MSKEGVTILKWGNKVPEVLPGFERPRKICIVGYAPSKDQAPFGDKSWEIWGLNDLYEHIPRWTRWFEVHLKADLDAYMTRGGKFRHIAGLQGVAAKCPLYMQEAFSDIPGSIRYPIEVITAAYGNYFTNTISYMIAMAIFEGCDELAIYGVDMAQETEYGGQRPSCEYFLGIALGAGIQLEIPNTADMLKTRFLYGYQDKAKTAFEERCHKVLADVEARRSAAQQQVNQMSQVATQLTGAADGIRTLMKIWG